MASRKRKPWNADLPLPEWAGGPKHVPTPAPTTVSVGHSTTQHFECGRCERLKLGNDVTGLDHSPRCPWRGKGDPGFG